MSVTGQNVITAVREIVAENPDFIYAPPQSGGQCLYVHPDEYGQKTIVGCLLARAFVKCGISVDPLAAFDTDDDGVDAAAVAAELGINATDDEGRWMVSVQGFQDARYPWNDAVILADSNVKV